MADISKEIAVQLARAAGCAEFAGEAIFTESNLQDFVQAAFKLGRNAGLEEAKQVAAAYGPSRPIVTSVPSLSVRGRWEGEQAASIGIALAIESLKDNTP